MTKETYADAYKRGFEITVRYLLSRGTPSRDSAEEAAQAGWARGWERLSQLQDERMVVRWVNTIALNVFRHVRRVDAHHEALGEQSGVIRFDGTGIDADKMLTFCRPGERVLLEQHMRGLTTEEIAREQGVSRTAIRIRLMRVRRAIRSRVESRALELRERNVASRARVTVAGSARSGSRA